MNVLVYIVKVMLVSGLLYGYYFFFLRNKTFHLYNRYYLLASAVLACVVPLVNLSSLLSGPEPTVYLHAKMYESLEAVTLTTAKPVNGLLNITMVTSVIYITVTLIFLVLILRSLLYLKRLASSYPSDSFNGIRIYQTDEPGTPFSFFRSIFWNNKIDITRSEGHQILKHELYHVKQLHSFDLLLLEAMILVMWMNPFFFLIKKELKTIHEFLADEFALHDTDKYEYAELLLTHAIKARNQRVANPFFHNQIKRRITMITTNSRTSFSYARRILVLPFAFILLMACTRNSDDLASKQVTARKATPLGPDTLHMSWEKVVELLKDTKEPISMTYQLDENVYITHGDKVYAMPYSKIPKMRRDTTDISENSDLYKVESDANTVQSKIAKMRLEDMKRNVKDQVFTKLEKEAEYPGGASGWQRYLSRTVHYPDEAVEKEIQGTVVVQFIVNANGRVSDVEVKSGPVALRAESVRLISESGNWVPGEHNGKKVASYRLQPITYRLESE